MMNTEKFKALTLIHAREVSVKKDTWLTRWFRLKAFIPKRILKQKTIICILVEKIFETTHQKGRRNQHTDLARLEFFMAYYVHAWIYALVSTGCSLTHAQDRVTFYLTSTDAHPNDLVFPNDLKLNNLEKLIQRHWRSYLPHFQSGKELNDFCSAQATGFKSPRNSLSELLQWEYTYIGIINLLIRTYQHASVRSSSTRNSLRECVRHPDSAFARGESHSQAEREVLGSSLEQEKLGQTFHEKIEASFYGTFNVGMWRDEDHAFKYMYEIAAHIGFAHHNICPPALSDNAHDIINLWCDEIEENGKEVLQSKDIYTRAIAWLLHKDVEIHALADPAHQRPEVNLMERFSQAACTHAFA
ncbi:hypothetical protein ABE530_17495 [Brucella sp. TWI559]